MSNLVYFQFGHSQVVKTNRQPSDVDDISDEELLRLRRQASGFELSPTSFGTHNIGRVTEHTVMKATQDVEEETDDPSEALVLQLVAQQTSIPVPQVRRLVKSKYSTYIAMEHISGQQLSVIWPTLSWFGRLRIAFTMHSYIRQLRTIRHSRSTIPGPSRRRGKDLSVAAVRPSH